MRGKKISTANAEKLMKIMDMVDKDKNVLIQLFKADIPFVSELAVTRLITKHKMKGAEINKLKSEALDKEDEPKVKELIKKLKGASQSHAGQAKDLQKALDEEDGHFMYKDGEKVMVKTKADHDKYAKMGYTMKEDGHADVSSAMRQCKTITEDATEIDSKLQTMSPEDNLPTWWTNKLAVASNSMNKMRDYIVNPIQEETELDEMKEPFVVVDTADGDKVVGTASSEKGAKEIITTAQLPPMKIKDKKTLKIVKVKKKQMIGYPIKEEIELDEQMRVFRVSSGKLQGNVHAKDEKEAEKIFRKKGAKGKITITDRGPVRGRQPRLVNDFEPVVEGTWTVPDTPAQKRELKKLLSKPLPLGKEGENAADKMYSIIGDDELFDDLYVAGKKDPKGDARPIIKKAMKRLKIKEEVELDEAKEVLSRFRDDKLKKSIMNLATQKGLKVKEMGDKLEVSGNAKKVMDLTLAVQKHDVKIEQNIMSAYTAAITKQLGVR